MASEIHNHVSHDQRLQVVPYKRGTRGGRRVLGPSEETVLTARSESGCHSTKARWYRRSIIALRALSLILTTSTDRRSPDRPPSISTEIQIGCPIRGSGSPFRNADGPPVQVGFSVSRRLPPQQMSGRSLHHYFQPPRLATKCPSLSRKRPAVANGLLAANLNATVFDFVTRQKVQGQTLNSFHCRATPRCPSQTL